MRKGGGGDKKKEFGSNGTRMEAFVPRPVGTKTAMKENLKAGIQMEGSK